AEGTSPGNLAAEPFRVHVQRIFLAADHVIGEMDFGLDAETRRVRTKLAEAFADHDLDRLENLDEAAPGRLADNAGLIDGGGEGGRAAVHDWNFGAVDLDGGVVDTHAAQGSEHVFGSGYERAFTVAENGRELGGDHGPGYRRNFAIGFIEAGPDKNK